MNKISYLFLMLWGLGALSLPASVSEYAFDSSVGTFTELSGATVLGSSVNDDECFEALPLGFSFTYNEVEYTQVSVATNGFIGMGPTVSTSNQPISASAASNNVVAGLGRDIKARANGEMMYQMSGTTPNRVFIVQWKHYQRTPTACANDDFSFQIHLEENGNNIRFVYGEFTAVTSVSAAAIQLGLRGDSATDFNNRRTSTDWGATIAGTAANHFCSLSATVYPTLGLSFTFSPPVVGEPPTAAQNPNPAHEALHVPLNAQLSWLAGGGVIDGYKIYLGTNTPPTNLVNGITQVGNSYDPADFVYSTTYYWQIVPFNSHGDALNCPIWYFNTLDDPTVSTFPFTQNFDNVYPPALPPGWQSINANNDNNVWESYNGNAQSQPQSMRMRFNASLAMDDWLILPPMQLSQGTYYKVRFYYRAGSATLPEKLALYWGSSPSADGMTEEIFRDELVDFASYRTGDGIMQAPADGIYYFGFKGFSDPDRNYLYIDTISLNVWEEQLLPPVNLSATVNGFDVQLAWEAPAVTRALTGYKVYRDEGPIATLDQPDATAYLDEGLSSGLYSYMVSAIYTTGESVAVGPVLADVDPVLLPPISLEATVSGRDVTLSWKNPEGDWISWSHLELGNSVGTNSAIVFDVAHRWTQDDLAPYAGRVISRLDFVPAFTNCIYTMKIWTGGSAAEGGNLVHSQQVSNPNINAWNTVMLNAHIPIPDTGDLYYGYEVNTQGGTPAGCDNGPSIEGKGNMMYFGGVWQTLTQLDASFTYNWNIRAFAHYAAADSYGAPLVLADDGYYSASQPLICQSFIAGGPERLVTGYKVYRDGALLATLNNAEVFTYTDAGLANAVYEYGVSTLAPTGESAAATVTVELDFQLAQLFFEDGFEDYEDFALDYYPWNLRDIDHSATLAPVGFSFPGAGAEMAFMVFNPSATTPAMSGLIPHGGDKMLASFPSLNAVNNDWLITPNLSLGTGSAIKFFARSHDDTAEPARFRVGVSTMPAVIIQSFTPVSPGLYVEAPAQWHEYVYDLSAYDNRDVFVGIRCLTDGGSTLYIDDISLHSEGGQVENADLNSPELITELCGNHPNPFNPSTTIKYSNAHPGMVKIDIFNVKGQKVRNLLCDSKSAGEHFLSFDGRDDEGRILASGLYYYRMQSGRYKATRKMVLLK